MPGHNGRTEDVNTHTKRVMRQMHGRAGFDPPPPPNPHLRTTPGGLLRIDKKKISDIALGYKSLLEVERGWRDMKQILDLRPVYHRREDRIRAHVLLCWLASFAGRPGRGREVLIGLRHGTGTEESGRAVRESGRRLLGRATQ